MIQYADCQMLAADILLRVGQTSALETAPAATAKPAPRPAAPARGEVIPEEVRRTLAEGERALASKQPTEAIRLASLSQRTQITGASFSLLTRAYCQRGDLSNARANLNSVPRDDKARVVQYCKRYEIAF